MRNVKAEGRATEVKTFHLEYISLLFLTIRYLLNHCLILLEVTRPYLIYFIDFFISSLTVATNLSKNTKRVLFLLPILFEFRKNGHTSSGGKGLCSPGVAVLFHPKFVRRFISVFLISDD